MSFAGWAEPEPDPDELPRIPPRSVEEAQRSFAIREGFRIEPAAVEPLVVDPVAISFDEEGALFVAEMRGYPEKRDEALGRIKRLTDLDGDGRYDHATVYAEGLKWPTGVLCWNGGVFVCASPDVLYFKDENGDGVAEHRRTALTGFGQGQKRLNMQALVNGLAWGPDGRIYGATAANGGAVIAVGPDGKGSPGPLNLRGADFSFDPLTNDLRSEVGTAQYGLTFDDEGRRYVCSNSRHALAVMYSWPWHLEAGLPGGLVDIAADGGAAEVFRTSVIEPWRIVRTRWRVQGKVGGPVEGGGRAGGYFTSASGLTIYRGNAMPTLQGNLFVGDVGSNLVHRKVIEHPGNRVQPVARRAPGEEKREFLSSSDNWFRPVMCANGPDGALYIVDMCRETIEHPWSLPESIKKHLDLYSGNDRGRIWRVVPEDFVRPEWKSFEHTPAGLAQRLGSSNAWERETAARLLFELSADPEPRSALEVALTGMIHPLLDGPAASRAQVLGVAEHLGGNAIRGWNAVGLMSHEDPVVRAGIARTCDPALPSLAQLAGDPDPRVRFAVALRTLDHAVQAEAGVLATLARLAEGDPWVLRVVAAAAKKRGLLPLVVPAQELGTAVALLEAAGVPIEGEGFEELYRQALAVLADEQAERGGRQAALRLVGRHPRTGEKLLWKIVEGGDPGFAPLAAEALVRRPPENWTALAFEGWPKLGPGVRARLLPRVPDRLLLGAIRDGTLRAEELGFHRQVALRRHGNKEIREEALRLLGKAPEPPDGKAAEHYRKALRLDGVAKRGRVIFDQRCALCHGEEEAKAGPALASLRNKGAAMLLENLLAPDREVAPQYSLWEVRRRGGEVLAGAIAGESADLVTLVRVDGSKVEVPREDIEGLSNLNRSLMPVGLEAGLTLQQMADLLAFLAGEK